jgi:hypothetical protein
MTLLVEDRCTIGHFVVTTRRFTNLLKDLTLVGLASIRSPECLGAAISGSSTTRRAVKVETQLGQFGPSTEGRRLQVLEDLAPQLKPEGMLTRLFNHIQAKGGDT